MGLCQSCCGGPDGESQGRYVKQGENELATQPPRQAVPPQSNKQKQESRERGWHSTGIVALREQNLKELPATVFAVSAAKVLDASNNRLKTIPDTLGQLQQLNRLVLVNNLLTAVNPTAISCLINLKLLNLDGNRLTALPDEVGNLSKLEKLSANNNQLTKLPSTLGSMAKLTFLTVSRNQIAELPEAMPPELEELDVSHNQIQAIPAALGGLQKLKIFNLDGNQVATVPPEVLMDCVSLHTLSLHANPITPDTLQDNPAFQAFEERRKKKYDKVIQGGVLMGSKGMDEGIDRNATRSP